MTSQKTKVKDHHGKLYQIFGIGLVIESICFCGLVKTWLVTLAGVLFILIGSAIDSYDSKLSKKLDIAFLDIEHCTKKINPEPMMNICWSCGLPKLAGSRCQNCKK